MEAKRDDRPGRQSQRRAYTNEFKEGAVRLVLDERKTIAQVARDLDLTASMLRIWVLRAKANRTGGKSGLVDEERAELARLRKENRQLEMERAEITEDRNTCAGSWTSRALARW